MPPMSTNTTYEQILNAAESLIQTQGYNAFSYKDLSEIVKIKTSSIHYYFPTKEDLCKAVIKRHVELLVQLLEELLENPKLPCEKKLDLFFDTIFAKTYLSQRKMCLGGMLASDVLTLTEEIQNEVKVFFKKVESWLEQLFLLGKKEGVFIIGKSLREQVLCVLAMLEGALLLARLYHDANILQITKKKVKEVLMKK